MASLTRAVLSVVVVGGGLGLASPGWAQSSVHDFELGGSAYVLNEECIRLTPDAPYASGSAWFKRPVDLRQGFEMRLQIVLGEKDQRGADGMVFVLHPRLRTGFRGEGMGFAGLVPSLGVEFDTYRNLHLDDPIADHMALMANGVSFHDRREAGLIELGNLEDGERHPLFVLWDPETQRLSVRLDGHVKASFPSSTVRRIFGNQNVLFWGMTAGTGRLSNAQDICIETPLLSVRGHSGGPHT